MPVLREVEFYISPRPGDRLAFCVWNEALGKHDFVTSMHIDKFQSIFGGWLTDDITDRIKKGSIWIKISGELEAE
jgi:hypothetical protein